MLYAARIDGAKSAWDHGSVTSVIRSLDFLRPKAGEPDRRGFEWHYLYRLAKAAESPPLEGTRQRATSQNTAAFSQDGKRLLTLTWNSNQESLLKVWDVQSARELHSWKLEDCGRKPTFSPDGTRLASASDTQKVINVWSTETGARLLSFPGGNGRYDGWTVLFSPDGSRLLRLSDSVLKVWDAQSGREMFSIDSIPNTIVFSPDAKRLAAGVAVGAWNRTRQAYNGGAVKIWDAHTGELLSTFRSHTAEVTQVVFSPDSRRIISVAGSEEPGSIPGELKVWDVDSGNEVFGFTEPTDEIGRVAYSPDGARFIVGSTDPSRRKGRTRVYDSRSGQVIYALPTWGEMAFSPDSQRLIGDDRSELRIWDFRTGEEIRTLKDNIGQDLRFSPDGKHVVTSAQQGIHLFDTEKSVPERQTVLLKGVNRQSSWSYGDTPAVFNSDLSRVAAISYSTVKVFELPSGKELRSLPGQEENVICVAITPDGKRVAAGAGGRRFRARTDTKQYPGTLKVWDVESERELVTIDWSDLGIVHLAFSPDGKTLAGSANDDTVKLWDVESGRELRTLGSPAPMSRVGNNLAFSPDGKRLACLGKIWDVGSGREMVTLKSSDAMAFSPDGQRVIGTIRSERGIEKGMFDATTGEQLFALGGGMNNIAFSPDGKRLAMPGLILDAQSGRTLLSLDQTRFHPHAAFSGDGYRLAVVTSFYSGEILIYDATPLPEKP
ncbi:MAG TPA: WD40 repeat domain-containing protein [Pirellulaceae bacterium]|jgi:WD40 repeat protein